MPAQLLSDTALRGYIDDVRAWHGYVRFLGLPTLQDHPDTPLSDLFVTPLLSEQRVSPESAPESWPTGSEVFTLLAKRRRLVVLGDPGSGKSTIVNWLAWLFAGGASSVLPEGLDDLLPLPMVARELRLDGVTRFDQLLDAFLARPVAQRLTGARAQLEQRLAEGRAIVLLDGLDEVALGQRQALRAALLDGWQRHPKLLTLATSRIVGYDECPLQEEISLPAAEGERPHGLPGAGDRSAPPVYVMPFDDGRIAAFAQQWYRLRSIRGRADQDAGSFVQALQDRRTIQPLARMPQLLTLMALVYRVRTQLPNGRSELYDVITQAYLESIDTARQIERSDESSWQEKSRWLARVGFEMQTLRDQREQRSKGKGGRGTGLGEPELLVSHAQVLGWLRMAMKQSGQRSDEDYARAYLDWVARRSGLLLPRGENRYAFVHLSFQEYFAAAYVVELVSDPDWVIAQRDGTAYGEGDDRVNAEALGQWGRSVLWQEVIVFAFERVASSPRTIKRLIGWLFGDDFKDFRAAVRTAARGKQLDPRLETARSELLARLVGNPHAKWSEQAQQTGLNSVLEYLDKVAAVFREDENYWKGERPALRRLMSQAATRKAVWVWISNAQPESLNLRGGGEISLTELPVGLRLSHLAVDGIEDVNLERLRKQSGLLELALGTALHLKSLDSLAELSLLKYLGIVRAPIKDLRVLSSLTNLEDLAIPHSLVEDVEPLRYMHRLKHLYASGTLVQDLTPLSECVELEILFIDETPVKSLAPLAGLTKLSWLLAPPSLVLPPALLKRQVSTGLQIKRFR